MRNRNDPMLDFDKLDRTIHEKGRLGIMTLLASRASWPFQDLKAELKMSDGNLITHLRTLHQAGYVAVTKAVLDRPQTSYSLTEKGRKVFQDYLHVLEQIVKAGKR
jgi:DNA-binding HxlR family transcriptional regulator